MFFRFVKAVLLLPVPVVVLVPGAVVWASASRRGGETGRRRGRPDAPPGNKLGSAA